MKVAIIANSKQSKDVDSYSEQALGPAHLAKATKDAGHDVQLYNHFPPIKELLDFDVIGFSVNSQDVPNVLETAEQLKKQKPTLVTIVGGPHVSGEISDCHNLHDFPIPFYTPLLTSPHIDFAFQGEADIEFPLFLRDNSKQRLIKDGMIYADDNLKLIRANPPNKKIISSKRIKNLDSIPFPTEFRDSKTFSQPIDNSSDSGIMIPIIESRGCPGRQGKNCDFCSSEASWGKSINYRSGKNVLAEVEEVVETYNLPGEGGTKVFFDSLELMASKTHLKDLMFAFENTPHKLASCGDLRLATPEYLELMQQGGYESVMWGIESLDENILKKYKPGLTIQQIEKGLKLTKKYGIRNYGLLMLGFPQETEQSIKKWTSRLKNFPLDSLRVSIITPFPGTKFRKDLIGKYEIEPYSKRYNTSHLVYNHPNISKQGMEELRSEVSSLTL